MATFGRRKAMDVPIGASPVDAPIEPISGPRRRPPILVLLGLYLVVVGPGTFAAISGEQRPLPQDRSPEAQFDVGPYSGPPSCAAHQWEPGEYLASICIEGQELNAAAARAVALDPARISRRGSGYRHWMWVRVGDDVLLVARPLQGTGEIQTVVYDRLAGDEAAPGAADVADYSRPPMDYRLDVAKRLLFPPLIAALVMIVGVWALRFTSERRPAHSVS